MTVLGSLFFYLLHFISGLGLLLHRDEVYLASVGWDEARVSTYHWPCVEGCIGPWRTCKLSCFPCKPHMRRGKLWSPECGHIQLPAPIERHISHWTDSNLWSCQQKQINNSLISCGHIQGFKLKTRPIKSERNSLSVCWKLWHFYISQLMLLSAPWSNEPNEPKWTGVKSRRYRRKKSLNELCIQGYVL